MIDILELRERAREWSLREDVVEKDYVLGWLLWGIAADPELGQSWVFKGGTCLKKCYIETYRFSEDLDFTVLPGGPVRPDDVARLLSSDEYEKSYLAPREETVGILYVDISGFTKLSESESAGSSQGKPPAWNTPRLMSSTRCLKCIWQGCASDQVFMMAMIGLPKSPSFIPVARQSARAPAMLRPCVEVRERYAGMESPYLRMTSG